MQLLVGLFTWIVIGAVVLAVIGLGIGTFVSRVFKGAQIASQNPVIRNATGEAKAFVTNETLGLIKNATYAHLQ